MEKNEIWETPCEPYFFKNSSRFQGKFLESFIFYNSEIFYELEKRIVRREGDALSRQIEFLISASKELEAEKVCPICGGAKIKFLLFLNFSILDLRLSCCDDPACKENLKSGRPESRLIPLNLNGLRQFHAKGTRKKAEIVFRQAFGVKVSTSPVEIFNKFNEAYLKSKETQTNSGATKLKVETSQNQGQGKSQTQVSDSQKTISFRARNFSGRKSDAKQIKLFGR